QRAGAIGPSFFMAPSPTRMLVFVIWEGAPHVAARGRLNTDCPKHSVLMSRYCVPDGGDGNHKVRLAEYLPGAASIRLPTVERALDCLSFSTPQSFASRRFRSSSAMTTVSKATISILQRSAISAAS